MTNVLSAGSKLASGVDLSADAGGSLIDLFGWVAAAEHRACQARLPAAGPLFERVHGAA
jgi:hypothetical protein